VYALAARGPRHFTALIWNYHDDDLPAPAAEIELTIAGLESGGATLSHYRVDGDHSNSYAAWLKMGSPQPPDPAQYKQLDRAGQLARLIPPKSVRIEGGKLTERFSLPAQGVSLVVISQR
jgi:xylan 1,4-beta-xylosidase